MFDRKTHNKPVLILNYMLLKNSILLHAPAQYGLRINVARSRTVQAQN